MSLKVLQDQTCDSSDALRPSQESRDAPGVNETETTRLTAAVASAAVASAAVASAAVR